MKLFSGLLKGFKELTSLPEPAKNRNEMSDESFFGFKLPSVLTDLFDEDPENSAAYHSEKEAAEHMYDELESEYQTVLAILNGHSGDENALRQALAQCEQDLNRKLETAFDEGDELKQRAREKMQGNDLEVMLRMGPSLLNADKKSKAREEVQAHREAKTAALRAKLEKQTEKYSGDTQEQLRRILALLEGLAGTRDTLETLDSVF